MHFFDTEMWKLGRLLGVESMFTAFNRISVIIFRSKLVLNHDVRNARDFLVKYQSPPLTPL